MVLVDWLMSDYGKSDEDAVTFPLDKAFALHAAARERHGVNDGNSVMDRRRRAAMRAMRRYLQEHYEIVPNDQL
jgi:hypothetical protein